MIKTVMLLLMMMVSMKETFHLMMILMMTKRIQMCNIPIKITMEDIAKLKMIDKKANGS